jgi:flagellar motor switch protein FliM
MSDLPDSAENPPEGVLARIVASHRRGAKEACDRTPELARAWERALRHAAVPFKGLDLQPDDISVVAGAPLGQALEALPAHGLVSALEDREGRRGLIALSHGAVDALIEVQTTGRVESRELPPRPVTRIDETLTRDFLDLALAAFAREAEGVDDRDWPERMNYASRIADPEHLTLLLPERPYHLLTAELRLGGDGQRRAQAVMAVPLTAPLPGEPQQECCQPEAWRVGLASALEEAELHLDAILFRTRRPLSEVESLSPGDLIHFDSSQLRDVTLESSDGRRVLSGKLGQINGHRALRISEPPATPGGVSLPGDPASQAEPGPGHGKSSPVDLADGPWQGGALPPAAPTDRMEDPRQVEVQRDPPQEPRPGASGSFDTAADPAGDGSLAGFSPSAAPDVPDAPPE